MAPAVTSFGSRNTTVSMIRDVRFVSNALSAVRAPVSAITQNTVAATSRAARSRPERPSMEDKPLCARNCSKPDTLIILSSSQRASFANSSATAKITRPASSGGRYAVVIVPSRSSVLSRICCNVAIIV